MSNDQQSKSRAIVTVIGKDKIGTVAEISSVLAKNQVNIEEISQTVLEDIFTMTMLVDLAKSNLNIAELSGKLEKVGSKINHEIHVHDEKIFDAMHRI